MVVTPYFVSEDGAGLLSEDLLSEDLVSDDLLSELLLSPALSLDEEVLPLESDFSPLLASDFLAGPLAPEEVGVLGVIGNVEAAAFELQCRSGEQTMNRATAILMNRERAVDELLSNIKPFAAFLTFVLI